MTVIKKYSTCFKEMKLSGLCGGASMYCLLLINNITNCEINKINSNKKNWILTDDELKGELTIG